MTLLAPLPAPARPSIGAAAGSGTARARRPRLLSLDVLRGLAVLGMLLVNNAGVRGGLPAQLEHAAPGGLHLADLVFPLFLYVAGVGLGLAPAPPPGRALLRRCSRLFLLGCLLVSAKSAHLAPSTGVLQHIALATAGAWLVLRLPRSRQPVAAAAVLLAAWALPSLVALPGTRTGSWDAQTTLASAVERALTGHAGGKEQVVASVVSMLTVLAGVFATRLLREHPAGGRLLLLAAAVSGAAGLALSTVVPLDKALWTPSYVLVTAAACAALHAGAVALLDRPGAPLRVVQPLRVLGANALAVYVAVTLLYSALLVHVQDGLLGPVRAGLGDRATALGWAAGSVVVGWALAAWLWRRGRLLTV